MPQVSVICSAYNAESYITPMIKSILAQTLYDIEFIIVNDGSTDRTLKMINEMEDSRLRKQFFDTNKGVSERLNTCISLSKSPYLAIIDSDDISSPLRLEKQFEFLERNRSYGVCGSFINFINDGSVKFNNWVYETEDERIKVAMLFNSPFCHSSVMMRKNILVNNGIYYDKNYKTAQDYKLWSDLSRYTKFKNLSEELLSYRIHDKQVSFLKGNSQMINRIKIMTEQIIRLGIEPSLDDIKAHARLAFGIKGFFNIDDPSIISRWTDKLLKYNNVSKIYNQGFLQQHIQKLISLL